MPSFFVFFFLFLFVFGNVRSVLMRVLLLICSKCYFLFVPSAIEYTITSVQGSVSPRKSPYRTPGDSHGVTLRKNTHRLLGVNRILQLFHWLHMVNIKWRHVFQIIYVYFRIFTSFLRIHVAHILRLCLANSAFGSPPHE